ncbi:polysaccharide pyruvyl transferase family protein [Acinetobacter pseudolwoffii]|uniref:polysaccharide pyruvyl transferase family protein n=1 Tax=Acinetobacter pseudolwoffii TaxID=2053287 RepID=UPI000C24D166|nr:polysaccharide pyruvyl transferase family protein [Acinetobacter pseudolwoffii]PJI34508.1 hypothetical protein CU318_11795 [Acinetobacter pseudolwoffii]
MKMPIFEIHGTGTHNRGAELMAIAISERIKFSYPNAIIIVSSNFGSFEEIKKHGFFTSLSIESRQKKSLLSLIKSLLNRRLIQPKNVDVILDASGFAFSDQWGEGPAKRLFDKANKVGRSSQTLILLPQALGSFEKIEVKKTINNLFNRASLVFARDNQSYGYAREIISESQKLKKSPDFTISIKPKVDNQIKLLKNFVGIVPNIRMFDKSNDPQQYISFLQRSINLIKDNKLNPVFIIHDAQEDRQIIEALGADFKNLPVFQHEDPRVLKWMLGQAQFVIGSRFHALVSSMSQGVPCIGAGWSHKYPELFSDFSNREALIDDLSNFKLLEEQILKLSDINYRNQKVIEISRAANVLKNQIDDMWSLVEEKINEKIKVNS